MATPAAAIGVTLPAELSSELDSVVVELKDACEEVDDATVEVTVEVKLVDDGEGVGVGVGVGVVVVVDWDQASDRIQKNEVMLSRFMRLDEADACTYSPSPMQRSLL